MSQANVEIVRRLSEMAYREGVNSAMETAIAEGRFDNDVEWVEDPAWPDAGTYRGLSAIRSVVAQRTDSFDVDQQIERLIDAGDDVVAFVRWNGRGHRSGAETETRLATVTTLRAGKVVRVRFYLDRQDALKAVGLEE